MRTLILSLVLSIASHGDVLRGKVVDVHDGDTMTLLAQKTEHKVRLDAIDAPEKKQAFGEVSRQALAKLIAGKDVEVKWDKKDRFERILGRVSVDGVEVNLRQVQAGMAWHFVEYNHEEKFAKAESTAKLQKLGLWTDANAMAPWEFRKQQKANKK